MWSSINSNGRKCKIDKCYICGKPHYALGLCRKHWSNKNAGRQIETKICKICKSSKVLVYKKEQMCSDCHEKYIRSINPNRKKKDGGKWGYKDYRKIVSLKKSFCEKCGSQTYIRLYHIDGNTRNSNPNNLITLCNKCHLNLHAEKNGHIKNSKFRKLYGQSLREMGKLYGCCAVTIMNWLKYHKNLDGFKIKKRGRPTLTKSISCGNI